MDTEDDNLKIAFGSAFVLVGITLVGVAMEIISRTQPIPWWAILLLVIGSGTLIVGLLILIVSSPTWRRIWYLVKQLPGWPCRAYQVIRYGPKYTIGDPTFSSNISELRQNYNDLKITASFMVRIKNKSKPLRVNLTSTSVCLEQRLGWDEQNKRFRLATRQGFREIILKPYEEWYEKLSVDIIGRQDSLPDINNNKRWGVWGIWVTLPKGVIIQLHKGANCQPPGQLRYGII